MTFAPRARISPSAMRISTPGSVAHRPELERAEVVHGQNRRGLGETVPLQNGNAGGVEELDDVAREGCAAGDEETQPAADARLQLLEHQGVGDAPTRRRDRADATAQVFAHPLPSRSHAPVEQPFLENRPASTVSSMRAYIFHRPRHRAHDRGRTDEVLRTVSIDSAYAMVTPAVIIT
jgi:hypothetical protein